MMRCPNCGLPILECKAWDEPITLEHHVFFRHADGRICETIADHSYFMIRTPQIDMRGLAPLQS